jgi:ribonuclease HI
MDSKAGFGVFFPQCNALEEIKVSKSLGGLCTVFQAEVLAITSGVCTLLQRDIVDCEVWLLSDSQAAIMALGSNTIKSLTVLDAVKHLNTLGCSNTVQVRWCPGHRGYQGNEVADELARIGSGLVSSGPVPLCPVASS